MIVSRSFADSADESIHYSVFSPPFASLYVYSNSDRGDMGNVKDGAEFAAHLRFLIPELLRVTKPGRLLSFHCMNLPTSKARDGYIGITDFRGELIRAFVAAGWIYHSEVCIWKDPVTAMQRTKALGLLHKQIRKDSAMSRQGIADYLVTMRKPGDNPEPVAHTAEQFPVEIWQRYASPVWMDIDASDTLQYMSAREHNDERHICPLQLGVIRRAMELWTNPGDTVPLAIRWHRQRGICRAPNGPLRFVGVELKGSYFKQLVGNLDAAGRQQEMVAPVTRPRFFVLTAGATPDDAIDLVESRGHVVVESRFHPTSSANQYGICEIEAPGEAASQGEGAA